MAFTMLARGWKLSFLALAAGGLSGCISTSALDELNGVTPQGSVFTQDLYTNYAYLARSFGDVGSAASDTFDDEGSMSLEDTDSATADLAHTYARKAVDAARGTEVSPEQAPDENAQGIRTRLIHALDEGRDKFPAEAARAQADYDCMILNATVRSMLPAAAQCGRSLQASLAQLERDLHPLPAPAPIHAATGDYTVYFDFNSWSLTGEDLNVLQNAVNSARAGGQSRITIVGHTDTSGSQGYNQHLSQHRATVVQEALVDMGARREAIQTSGVGESDLAVATADGVKESKNRRAIVTLLP